jgi:hypothetical protein
VLLRDVQVRLYRVRWFFRYLEYDLTVSLLTVTVARNLVIVLYLTHWVACGFNFLAVSGGYDPDMLVGLNPDLFASISKPEQYMYRWEEGFGSLLLLLSPSGLGVEKMRVFRSC